MSATKQSAHQVQRSLTKGGGAVNIHSSRSSPSFLRLRFVERWPRQLLRHGHPRRLELGHLQSNCSDSRLPSQTFITSRTSKALA
ncbi:hypothetical protein SprV_0602160000 [Sparganum proliferum]